MFCPKCGKELREYERSCPYCGAAAAHGRGNRHRIKPMELIARSRVGPDARCMTAGLFHSHDNRHGLIAPKGSLLLPTKPECAGPECGAVTDWLEEEAKEE